MSDEDFLAEMTRTSLERSRALAPRSAALAAAAQSAALPLPLTFAAFGVIAEIKPRAPSAGVLTDEPIDAVCARAAAYASGGAVAVSVLTEPTRFGGSIALLEDVASMLRTHGVPAMRKDFLVDPIQVTEARAAGASGVLIVARIVDDTRLSELLDAATSLDLFALVEAFDEADLARIERALRNHSRGVLVGVNARDLRTLAIDRERFARLASHLPRGVIAIAESGIERPDDVMHVAALGYRGALVGTSLMRAGDPEAAVRALACARPATTGTARCS